ncbi:MAG: citrate/2-methylcitrate synthase [Lachnospiraceae bacterium]|nr:citrate/2-methylcitrate synthase [Lachnospiraceae bacterium]
MDHNVYSEVTPEIERLSKMCMDSSVIDSELYTQYDVKRGLRDQNGKGVLAGLTNISDVRATKTVGDNVLPDYGALFYRGYNVKDLCAGFSKGRGYGFEETTYLLLFGRLPDEKELKDFSALLGYYRSLPTSFVRDIIMKAPSKDMMNTLARSVLTLYSYDDFADDVSLPNVLRQCLQLISLFPLLSIYGYHSYKHYHDGESLIIHQSDPTLTTAENILHILRPNSKYSELEARILDICLVIHAEHGGGNNSSFTTHVVSSTLTDTYSVMAAAIGSLKGPRHGGANIKVVQMFEDIQDNVRDWTDRDEVEVYLKKILHGEAFDNAGLIYGVGHAIYSKSDPRAEILRSFVKELAIEKGLENEYELYSIVEDVAPKIIADERKMFKGVSINVDFYSGLVYHMLNLPIELYTPIFAMARISGWSAHRLEELCNSGKIIRPAYKTLCEDKEYIAIENR